MWNKEVDVFVKDFFVYFFKLFLLVNLIDILVLDILSNVIDFLVLIVKSLRASMLVVIL